MGRNVELDLYEDNQAASQIAKTGKSQKLRHVRRTHGISISALHGWYKSKEFNFVDCHTKAQAADLLTKAFTNPEQWEHAYTLIGVLDGDTVRRILRQGGRRPPDANASKGVPLLWNRTKQNLRKAIPPTKLRELRALPPEEA